MWEFMQAVICVCQQEATNKAAYSPTVLNKLLSVIYTNTVLSLSLKSQFICGCFFKFFFFFYLGVDIDVMITDNWLIEHSTDTERNVVFLCFLQEKQNESRQVLQVKTQLYRSLPSCLCKCLDFIDLAVCAYIYVLFFFKVFLIK